MALLLLLLLLWMWSGLRRLPAVVHVRTLGTLMCQPPLNIVSAVVAGLGKSRLNFHKEVNEFNRTSLTSLREANASLKGELKVVHAQGDAKAKRIALGTR